MGRISRTQTGVATACQMVWLLAMAVAASGWIFAGDLVAQDLSTVEAQEKFFETKIRPVLARECYGCHSSQSGQARGGLLLDTRESSYDGGDSGPAVVPGDLDESLIINAMAYEDYRMPPGGRLSDRVLADFRAWIESGAYDPREREIQKIQSTIASDDIEKGKQFWSFVPPRKPDVAKPTPADWAQTPIDQFVFRKLQTQGLRPVVDAEPNTLLRRLALDLTGLPVDEGMRSTFLSKWETEPEAAIEDVVDLLLADEAYGERWGRHWLDVARYAESSGKEVNLTYPHAWRYRDYVIDSFNHDRPYDEFLQQQIAGDLLPVGSGSDRDERWAENLVATGFLALGTKTLTERNGRQFELDLVDEQIDVLGSVVMGVSVACARCHDHKFDPIPQSDYYALAGIFQSTDTYYGTIDSQQNRRASPLLTLPVSDETSTKLTRSELQRLSDELVDNQEKLREALRARRQGNQGNGPSSDQRRSFVSVARVSAEVGWLKSKIGSYDEDGNPISLAMGVQDADVIEDTRLLVRGEFDKPADLIPRGFPQVLTDQPVLLQSNGSGRRELASWLTDPAHPLTARVMANRVWANLMGRGIVSSTQNFGSTGASPTHPELLDYLAVRFVEEGWSIKKLIREIVTSRVYRLSSDFEEVNYEADPDNQWLWRHQPRRLDAEVIRDCMLAASGQLDRDRPNRSLIANAGPAVVRDEALVAGTMASMSDSSTMQSSRRARRSGSNDGIAQRTQVALDAESNHRSIYLPVARDQLIRSMDVLDFADPNRTVGRREESNTPDQGLYFLNNPFVIQQSHALAKRLIEERTSKNVTKSLKQAIEHVYGRPADSNEVRSARKFLALMKQESLEKKLVAFCQALFASAEFRYTR